MTHTKFENALCEILPEAAVNVIDEIVEAACDFADREVGKASDNFICDCPAEEDVWAKALENYEIPNYACADLEECIRKFDDDPQTAKFLLSRALKDIPGAPQWLD